MRAGDGDDGSSCGKCGAGKWSAAKIGAPMAGFTLGVHTKVSLLLDNGELTTGVSGARGERRARRDDPIGRMRKRFTMRKDRKEIATRLRGNHIEGMSDEFLPGGGSATREFTPLSWRTWRYLQIDVETANAPMTVRG